VAAGEAHVRLAQCQSSGSAVVKRVIGPRDPLFRGSQDRADHHRFWSAGDMGRLIGLRASASVAKVARSRRSVPQGLALLGGCDLVLIHDCPRPLCHALLSTRIARATHCCAARVCLSQTRFGRRRRALQARRDRTALYAAATPRLRRCTMPRVMRVQGVSRR